MLKPAVERHLDRRAGEFGEFCEADGNRDAGLHSKLTLETDAEITNGFTGLHFTVVPESSVRSETVSFSSIWREPNHISFVLAALSCS